MGASPPQSPREEDVTEPHTKQGDARPFCAGIVCGGERGTGEPARNEMKMKVLRSSLADRMGRQTPLGGQNLQHRNVDSGCAVFASVDLFIGDEPAGQVGKTISPLPSVRLGDAADCDVPASW